MTRYTPNDCILYTYAWKCRENFFKFILYNTVLLLHLDFEWIKNLLDHWTANTMIPAMTISFWIDICKNKIIKRVKERYFLFTLDLDMWNKEFCKPAKFQRQWSIIGILSVSEPCTPYTNNNVGEDRSMWSHR